MTIKELIEKRNKAIADARAFQAKADAEKRSMTAEEQKSFDTAMDEADKLKTEADGLNATAERRSRLEDAEKAQLQPAERRSQAGQPGAGGPTEQRVTPQTNDERRNLPEYRSAFRAYLRDGFGGFGPVENRAVQADSDVLGGYLVAPPAFVNDMIVGMKDLTFMRKICTVLPATAAGASLGVPTLDTDMNDADWTTELQTGSEDTAMRFGKRQLSPHPMAKLLKISNTLLRVAALPAENIVRDRLAYKFGITEEKAFLTGSGAGRPLGVFTASADGVPTSRDVACASTTAIAFDDLVNCLYGLKEQYRSKASWLFHRAIVKVIRKLKDGEGQYLWQPSVVAGQPDMLLNRPLYTSEYAPSTQTTGLYVGMLADWSFYWIATALGMSVQRLVELYAAANQTGLIGRMESDGMPVLAEAFSRLKQA